MVIDHTKQLPPPSTTIPPTDKSSYDMSIVSFGRLSRAAPPAPHYIIDVSEWRDPIGSKKLRELYNNGLAGEVQDFVQDDPKTKAALSTALAIAYSRLVSESTKGWLSLGIRDHHGRWTAPAMAEIIASELNSKLNLGIFIRHADLNSMGSRNRK